MRAVIRFGAVIGVVAAMSVVALAQHPGRNSFLVVSAHTTSELVQQVRENPTIRDSYERHFQMNESQLYTYLRTLHPVRLDDDQVFTIYSVPPGGELKAHTQRLKKGELVFADMNGTPILRARCGNPLVGAPPGVIPQEEVSGPNAGPKLLDVPVAETVPNIPLAMAPAPPIVPEEVAITPVPVPPVTTVASQSIPIWPLLALPIIGGSTHGGGTPGGPPVPEPTTMVALAAGASALLARRRKKN
jgi:hypothetical protein